MTWLWRPRGRFLMLLLSGLLVWAGIVVLNPLGIYDFATDRSVKLFVELLAPWYGDARRRVQDGILVVLLTEKAQARYGHFPLSIDEYGQLLASILEDKPRAVFVDVGFDRLHRESPNAASEIVDWLAKDDWPAPTMPVPLVFGTGGPDGDMDVPVKREIRELADRRFNVQHALTLLDRDPSLYPLVETDSGPGREQHETAAFKLFSLTCDSEQRGDCPASQPERYKEAMAVQWGLQPPRTRRLDRSCLSAGHHWTGHLWHSTVWLIHEAIPGVLAPIVQPCKYTEWLDALELDDHPEAAASLIQGRTVLFGIEDGQDLIESPVNGYVGGVFLHAMALDNLEFYGSGYYRDLGSFRIAGFSLPAYRLYSLLVWICISAFLAWRLSWPYRWKRFRSRLLGWPIISSAAHVWASQPRRRKALVALTGRPVWLLLLLPGLTVGTLMALDILIVRARLADLLILAVLYPAISTITEHIASIFNPRKKRT